MQEQRRGYLIEINSPPKDKKKQDEQILRIDHQIVPYQATDEGYKIYYNPPAPSLYEAACHFVDTQRKKQQ